MFLVLPQKATVTEYWTKTIAWAAPLLPVCFPVFSALSSLLAVHQSSLPAVQKLSPPAAAPTSPPAAPESSLPAAPLSSPMLTAAVSLTSSQRRNLRRKRLSAPAPEFAPVLAPAPEFSPVSAPAPESAPVLALAPDQSREMAIAPDQSREMALAPDQSHVMSLEALSISLVLSTWSILVSLVLSIEVLQKQAASLVMATEAIPKPLASLVASMEAVPESNPERAPDSTFSPRRAVGLMSGPEWTSDSEPSPEGAPVPEFSPERAPVPKSSPERAVVPSASRPKILWGCGGGGLYQSAWPAMGTALEACCPMEDCFERPPECPPPTPQGRCYVAPFWRGGGGRGNVRLVFMLCCVLLPVTLFSHVFCPYLVMFLFLSSLFHYYSPPVLN